MEKDEKEVDTGVEQFKIKRLIKKLNEAKSGGSVISLIIPSKTKICDYTNMLSEEFGKAANIKDRTNRQSVQDAITSAINKLKLYNKAPVNGLVVYCGIATGDDGKEKKIMIDFEPYRPINTSLYSCDNKFHVEKLTPLLENEQPFGFIVVDGSGSIYAKLQGDSKQILQQFSVELPKQHGRGGQSSVRFARLRVEKRHNYLRKVTEVAAQCFIENDVVKVQGLVLAGCGDFKSELAQTQMLDPRLAVKIIKILDVSYGGENGLSQAIELSKECLTDVKFVQEKNLIAKFFEQVAKDTGQIVYGIEETMSMLEDGTLEEVVCYENVECFRVTLRRKEDGKLKIMYVKGKELGSDYGLKGQEQEYEYVESMNIAEWLSENYSQFGATLKFITNKSAEGFQFIKGFSGLGGFLRYKVDIEHFVNQAEEWKCEDDDFI